MGPRLHFSIGPVQGFVSAARRTRDLWAGSWLLSHLSEQAVKAVASTDGVKLILPQTATGGSTSETGNVELIPIAVTPNRLIAEGDEQALRTAAHAAVKAVQAEWKTIHQTVWSDFVEPVVKAGSGNDTAGIWERQVTHFWEINWVIGDVSAAAGRKAWRSAEADEEWGFRCALFPHLQELSGAIGQRKPNEFKEFWQKIGQSNKVGEYDLDELEAMSAIGLIKRLYPRLDRFKALQDQGWPSTAWVAALPWIKKVMKDHLSAADAYVRAIEAGLPAERIFGSTGPAKQVSDVSANGFPCLDGQLLFGRGIEALAREKDAQGKPKLDDQEKQKLVQAHRTLCKEAKGGPVPWFGVLVMDGDQMGKLLGTLNEDERSKLSKALGAFAKKVNEVVEKHGGRTVYAGGDDVLALLPAASAIECAQELRSKYIASFEKQLGKNHAGMKWVGISAGLVFADWKTPLRQVLREAHRLLDDVAKEATGRDALAVSVWLASGNACQWSAPWEMVNAEEDGLLRDLLHCGKSNEVSAGFVYGVRESLMGLFDRPRDRPGEFAKFPEGLDLEQMLLADLVRIHGNERKVNHEKTAASLTRLSQRHRRIFDSDGKASFPVEKDSFSFDGLRLSRFLVRVQKGEA